MGEQSERDTEQESELDASISQRTREELESKEPSEETKRALHEEHEGHLVRDTTSRLSMEADVSDGVEAAVSAEVPDLYCFTCDEWVGLSGVELRGTPRSRVEAYYLGGMPVDVLHAKNGAAKTLNELADALVDRVDHLEDRSAGFDFIETELEEIRNV